MPNIADGIYKIVEVPLEYVLVGPFIGFARGLNGKDTPVDYREIFLANLDIGKLKEYEESFPYYGIEDDAPANIGCMLASVGGTLTGIVPWAVARGGRALLYDGPRKILKSSS